MTPDADPGRAAAVALHRGADFLGSGFFAAPGLVVTAAHVVVGSAGAVRVAWEGGSYEVAAGGIEAHPPLAGHGRFHPYPDLALLRGPAPAGHAVAVTAAADPPRGTEVTAVGYSLHTPTPGVQPDTLSLRVGARSAGYLRVLGDGVRDGFSGSMLVDGGGLVAGVLKGSRSYADAQGGWFTPVTALRALLGAPADPLPAVAAPPSDADFVDALMAFPALARPEARYDLADRMGDHLGLPYSFEVGDRPSRREHLFQLVAACRRFRDQRAALTALFTAMEEVVSYDRALDGLRELVVRATGEPAARGGA